MFQLDGGADGCQLPPGKDQPLMVWRYTRSGAVGHWRHQPVTAWTVKQCQDNARSCLGRWLVRFVRRFTQYNQPCSAGIGENSRRMLLGHLCCDIQHLNRPSFIMDPPPSTPPARDPNYYFEDGNTVILVENTLFKLHRLEPTRQSMLDRVFSNSAPLKNQAGESDDNPIRLQGDSLEEVRALVDHLYVLPHNLRKGVNKDNTDSDIRTRCCLARIAHRHGFDSIEEWALGTLTEFWKSRDKRNVMPILGLVETTKVVSQCQSADLAEVVTELWMKLIKSGNVLDVARAISIAERHNLRYIEGLALYKMMLLHRNNWDQDGVLTTEQRMKLLSGFYGLVHQCYLLKTQEPPEITHSACVSSPSLSATCRQSLIELWGNTISAVDKTLSPADYFGRLEFLTTVLKELHDSALAEPTVWKMAAGCVQSALGGVEAMSAACRQRLPDIFA